MSDNTLYVVSGFMRTGTSMMMRALEAGGMDAEYQQSREQMRKRFADEQYDPNIGGLYELQRQDYQNIEFPRQYKGKLIKALAEGVPRMRTMDEIKVIFMRRDPEEIRQSYDAFFGQQLPAVQNKEAFEKRMEIIQEKIANRRDVSTLDVLWFRDVIGDPQKCFEQLKERGWPIDVQKAVEVVDPELYRFRKEQLDEGVL